MLSFIVGRAIGMSTELCCASIPGTFQFWLIMESSVMFRQSSALPKGFLAVLTTVRFFITVSQLMFLQIRLPIKISIAYAAFKWFFSCMESFMVPHKYYMETVSILYESICAYEDFVSLLMLFHRCCI